MLASRQMALWGRTAVFGILTFGALAVVCSPSLLAQQETNPSLRRVVNKLAPAYPELARRMNIRGTVRVALVVAPNGKVKSTKVLGGSPLLARSAEDTLRKWRFEPAPQETTEIVELNFNK